MEISPGTCWFSFNNNDSKKFQQYTNATGEHLTRVAQTSLRFYFKSQTHHSIPHPTNTLQKSIETTPSGWSAGRLLPHLHIFSLASRQAITMPFKPPPRAASGQSATLLHCIQTMEATDPNTHDRTMQQYSSRH